MKLFITGASGFIGGALVQALAGEHALVAMARSEAAARKVEALGARAVRCDLADVSAAHLAGCEAVIHAAAFTKEWGTRAEFWAATVHGTQRLLAAARAAGVKRFLHISTEAVLFTGQDLKDIDETYPLPRRSRFLYSESKLEAEKAVVAANVPGVFETVVVRPRLVWGPGDVTVLPVLVEQVRTGKFVWIDHGRNRTSTTHIANLVAGVRCALERGRGGEVYFLTDGEVHSYKDFLTAYLATQGVTVADKSLPKWLVRSASVLIEAAWRLLRRTDTPPLTRLVAYMLSSDFTIRHNKATRELGYRPVISVAEGMRALRERA